MPDPQGLDLREAVDGLTGYAHADLNALWRDLPEDPVLAREALNDVMPALIETYGAAAATLATDWYDDLRETVDLPQQFAAVPAAVPDVGAYALVGWATTIAQSATGLRSLVEGGMQRRIATFSRLTVMQSAVRDPGATGWQRVGVGQCRSGFCDVLIGRGTVYRTESSASFASHDNCKCGAVPAWGGEPVPVRPYTPSTRVSDADRERTREWFKENQPSATGKPGTRVRGDAGADKPQAYWRENATNLRSASSKTNPTQAWGRRESERLLHVDASAADKERVASLLSQHPERIVKKLESINLTATEQAMRQASVDAGFSVSQAKNVSAFYHQGGITMKPGFDDITFHHEMGHHVERSVAKSRMKNYADSYQMNNRFDRHTDYAKTSYGESFAESYAAFLGSGSPMKRVADPHYESTFAVLRKVLA